MQPPSARVSESNFVVLAPFNFFLRAVSVAPRLDRRGGGVVEIITVCHCRCYKSFMDDVIT